MNYRALGRTGWKVSEISFGAWAIGGAWGQVTDEESLGALNQAIDSGINFLDTADVYGNGRSHRLIGKLKKARKEEIIVATKVGRRLPKQTVEGYSRANLTSWVEYNLLDLNVEVLDLVQLHCPPTDAYYHPEIFGVLDDLVEAGKIRFYGVSVERVEEALKAMEYPNLQSVQIIFNCFRQRPAELFFAQAKLKQVGILARIPLASGLLTGKFRADTKIRCRRSSQLQSPGPALRYGRDLLRGRLRRGAGSSGRDPRPGTGRRQHEPVCLALDSHVRCGQLRHPRRQAPHPGSGQRAGVRSSPAHPGGDGKHPKNLRREDPASRASTLVSRG